MMSEDRIAKMVARIAEDNTTATRDNVRYERWSGVIDYNGTRGAVKEATFALVNGGISWEEGTWLSGTWNGGTWRGGVHRNGEWYGGRFDWDKDKARQSVWENGIWFDGIWTNGDWRMGQDENRRQRTDSPDKWSGKNEKGKM